MDDNRREIFFGDVCAVRTYIVLPHKPLLQTPKGATAKKLTGSQDIK